MKRLFAVILLCVILLQACGTATSVSPTDTVAPTSTRRAAIVQSPTATRSLEPSETSPPTITPPPTITLTPTLGPPTTRTPAPPAVCPEPGIAQPIESETMILPELETQILAYLNARGSADGLEANLETLSGTLMADAPAEPFLASVVTQDVTGDTTPDVILGLTLPYGYGYGAAAIYFFYCQEGQYVSVPWFIREGAGDRAEGLYSGGGARIMAVQDMNLNGVPEIVMAVYWTDQKEFYIAEWDGAKFASLIRRLDPVLLEEFANLTVYDGDVTIADVDRDGTFELVANHRIGPSIIPLEVPIPERDRTETWAWNGYLFALARTQYGPPIYRFQAVSDGDDDSFFGDYDRALARYQQAIFDVELLGWSEGFNPYSSEPLQPDPEEWPRLEAYSRFRIMLLHVVRGYMKEAQVVYDTLQEKFPEGTVGHEYAEMATAFWDAFHASDDVAVACSAAIAHGSLHEDEILVPLSRSFYRSWAIVDAAEEVCPFE